MTVPATHARPHNRKRRSRPVVRWIVDALVACTATWALAESVCWTLARQGLSDDAMFAVQSGAVALLPIVIVFGFGIAVRRGKSRAATVLALARQH